MGYQRLQLTPEIIGLMNPEDQMKYTPGQMVAVVPPPEEKIDKWEREEQRVFANWCLRHLYAIVWHSTRHRSKASLGCPDFIIGLCGITLWIEFKRKPNGLLKDQKDFRATLEGQGIHYYIVYSAQEAIELTEKVIGLKSEILRLSLQLESMLL